MDDTQKRNQTTESLKKKRDTSSYDDFGEQQVDIAKIAEEFRKSIETMKELPIPIDNDTSGTPIFCEEDIKKSKNDLDVLLRTLFVKYGITRLMFTRQFQRCAISMLNIAEMNINAQRENYLRAIRDGGITWPKFCRVLLVILGLKIARVTLSCIKFDGTKVTVDAQVDNIQTESPDTLASRNPLNDD